MCFFLYVYIPSTRDNNIRRGYTIIRTRYIAGGLLRFSFFLIFVVFRKTCWLRAIRPQEPTITLGENCKAKKKTGFSNFLIVLRYTLFCAAAKRAIVRQFSYSYRLYYKLPPSFLPSMQIPSKSCRAKRTVFVSSGEGGKGNQW